MCSPISFPFKFEIFSHFFTALTSFFCFYRLFYLICFTTRQRVTFLSLHCYTVLYCYCVLFCKYCVFMFLFFLFLAWVLSFLCSCTTSPLIVTLSAYILLLSFPLSFFPHFNVNDSSCIFRLPINLHGASVFFGSSIEKHGTRSSFIHTAFFFFHSVCLLATTVFTDGTTISPKCPFIPLHFNPYFHILYARCLRCKIYN